MRSLTLPGGWLCLPDQEGATAVTGTVLSPPLVRHPSGNPWILGDAAVRVARASGVQVAVIGSCLVDDTELERGAYRAATQNDADTLMRWPGSFHLLVSWPGRCAAYGDVAGLHRLYTTTVDGVPVVSNHARVAAKMADAPLDEAGVASLLLTPTPPQTVSDTYTPWVGVTPVPPAHMITLDNPTRPRPYWQPPTPHLTLAEGAHTLTTALATAVEGRVRDQDATVQLSGGMDSTALAALAHTTQPATRMVTITTGSPTNEDQEWAGRVTTHLGAEHQIISDLPDFYIGIGEAFVGGLDTPGAAAGASRLAHLAKLLGPGVHLNGQGGDEVLEPPTGTTVRDLGVRDVRRLRGHAALLNTSTISLLRHAYSLTPLSGWMHQVPSRMRDGGNTGRDLAGWEVTPQLGPWATQEAEEAVSHLIRTTKAPSASPRFHTLMARIRTSATGARSHRDTVAALGARVEFPFLDRAVIETCLSVRPSHRYNPWEFKPLLREAMRGRLPAELRTRTTKDTYDDTLTRCWGRYQGAVMPHLLDGRLVARGILDRDALAATAPSWPAHGLSGAYIERVLGVEYWLRDWEATSWT